MQEIRNFIENIYPINDSDWNYFSNKLEKIRLKKKSILLNIGCIESNLYFISKGIVRQFIPKNENDLTFGFLFENEFVTAYDSFLSQTPSQYSLEALTEVSLWKISKENLEDVFENTLKEISDYGFRIKHFRNHSDKCLAGEDLNFIKKFNSTPGKTIFNPVKADEIFQKEDFVD